MLLMWKNKNIKNSIANEWVNFNNTFILTSLIFTNVDYIVYTVQVKCVWVIWLRVNVEWLLVCVCIWTLTSQQFYQFVSVYSVSSAQVSHLTRNLQSIIVTSAPKSFLLSWPMIRCQPTKLRSHESNSKWLCMNNNGLLRSKQLPVVFAGITLILLSVVSLNAVTLWVPSRWRRLFKEKPLQPGHLSASFSASA